MEINQLPEDLVNIIKSYIPIKFLSLTNKYYWGKNFNITYDSKLISSYWRFLLRNDIDFIFYRYLINAKSYFLKEKRIIYKSQIYPRRLELVNYLINFVFDSQKCKIMLDNFMKEKRLVFKKIRVKLNKWSN
tara:strand:- start:2852 stop:3247 length:396 start_codon:yes stop_codon:yes gene_type:complete